MSVRSFGCATLQASDAEALLLSTSNAELLTRVSAIAAQYNMRIGEYACNAVRRFADQANHDEWVSFMGALARTDEPTATYVMRAIAWAIDRDDGLQSGQGTPIGALVYEDSAAVNALMFHCAEDLKSAGFKIAGLVQANPAHERTPYCEMILRELTSGVNINIAEDRGPGARGCKLDHDAFATASQLCMKALEENPEIVFVNKFGKLEVQGKGLCKLIADAVMRHVPVLIGVPHRNLAAFESFIGGPYRQLAASDVLAWCDRHASSRRQTWPETALSSHEGPISI